MKNVLFVCIGNSCRSQMAEGFARKYGSDVMEVMSAGLAPASIVQPLTIEVMAEKNVDIRDHFTKTIQEFDLDRFDLIVNMSGQSVMPGVRGRIVSWDVADPIMQPRDTYLAVREKIESLVMQLVLSMRGGLLPGVTPKPAKVQPQVVKTSESSGRFGFGRVRRARD